jgi:hypothetical protein
VDDIFGDMVRVHQKHRPFSRAGQVIAIRHGKHRMLAVARGALKNSADTISLDQRSREKLDVKPREEAEFIFESATSIDQFRWAWRATNAMPRVAARLGILSVILGGVGLLLGALSLWLTLRG